MMKNCLGALDGTYIKVRVPEADKSRYRTRKNEIATNVLGVCSQDMQFIYVLPGWEGSTQDMRVLRDAMTRRNSLKVPHGNYFSHKLYFCIAITLFIDYFLIFVLGYRLLLLGRWWIH